MQRPQQGLAWKEAKEMQEVRFAQAQAQEKAEKGLNSFNPY